MFDFICVYSFVSFVPVSVFLPAEKENVTFQRIEEAQYALLPVNHELNFILANNINFSQLQDLRFTRLHMSTGLYRLK